MNKPCKHCKMHQVEKCKSLYGEKYENGLQWAEIEKDGDAYYFCANWDMEEIAIEITHCPWCGRRLDGDT